MTYVGNLFIESVSLCSGQLVNIDLYSPNVAAGLLMTLLQPISVSLQIIWCCIKHVWSVDRFTALMLCIKMTNFLFAKLTTAIQLFSMQLLKHEK